MPPLSYRDSDDGPVLSEQLSSNLCNRFDGLTLQGWHGLGPNFVLEYVTCPHQRTTVPKEKCSLASPNEGIRPIPAEALWTCHPPMRTVAWICHPAPPKRERYSNLGTWNSTRQLFPYPQDWDSRGFMVRVRLEGGPNFLANCGAASLVHPRLCGTFTSEFTCPTWH